MERKLLRHQAHRCTFDPLQTCCSQSASSFPCHEATIETLIGRQCDSRRGWRRRVGPAVHMCATQTASSAPFSIHRRLTMAVRGREIGMRKFTVFNELPGRECLLELDVHSIFRDKMPFMAPMASMAPNLTAMCSGPGCACAGQRCICCLEGLCSKEELHAVHQFRCVSRSIFLVLMSAQAHQH